MRAIVGEIGDRFVGDGKARCSVPNVVEVIQFDGNGRARFGFDTKVPMACGTIGELRSES